MSSRGGKLVIASVAIVTSVYFGVNFWKPIVIEQLRKDGNLREDIKIDQAAMEEEAQQPKSWSELRQKFEAVVDPEKNFSAEDQKGLESLQRRLEKNKTFFDELDKEKK
ncbi:Protein ECM19 [Candida viswanathii]|uniref:Protein ECM19 n=1 Tax=Candida viswanathii TaxID=5486 RepID=A0A367YCB5_9ASCO|nr:Protein ECM19 [Candida viswanathii]